uniref:Uncharacterized protein n=1 Tax=Lotus japonicus TaxID=34305 RepID=I3T1W7_LOTJA|nr:unknown [Lotus japonicus]
MLFQFAQLQGPHLLLHPTPAIPDQMSTELYGQVLHEKYQTPQQVLQQKQDHNHPARETTGSRQQQDTQRKSQER